VTGIRRKVNYPDPRDVCESIFAKMAAMQLNQTWFQPKGRPSAQEHRLRLKRPTPCVYAPVPLYIKLNPRPLLALATSAFFRGSLRFRPKKHGTLHFSARNRTSKYSRSCSQSLAELLRLRKAGRTPDPSSGFTNDVLSLFVSSQSKEDGLTKLSVAGPLGKLDLGDQDRLNPFALFHD